MVAIFIDGFDKYGPTNTVTSTVGALLTANEWTSVFGTGNNTTGTATIGAGLSSTGNSVNVFSGTAVAGATAIGGIIKTLITNYPRIIGGTRFNSTFPADPSLTIIFRDGSSIQCSITLSSGGVFSLRTGSATGTILSSGGAISASSTHYVEWDITIGASASYQIWLDGVSLFSGTGNTRGGTSNNYMNQFGLGSFSPNNGLNNFVTYDDSYLFDNTGGVNDAVLNTNPRIETQYPVSDSSIQFNFGAGILGTVYEATTNQNAPGANQLFLRRFTPGVNCTINSVSIRPAATSSTVNFKAVIYTNSSGSPNTLLSSGNQVTSTTSGTVLTGTLVTPQSLTSGTAYWIGFITDTSIALQQTDNTTNGVKAANTYGSGAPGTAPGVTTGQPSWNMWGNLTGISQNWAEVAQNPASSSISYAGDVSFVYDSVVTHEDLYNFPVLTSTPATIHTVCVKANLKNNSSGARTIDLRTKSVSTDSAGSNAGQAPTVVYLWYDSFFSTDPATSSPWTPSGLNNATSGIKIAS